MARTKRAAGSRLCNIGVATDDPALPVAGTGTLSFVRKSKRSKWRAGVLVGVHALVALHVTHYLIAGRTLSPVEPSESMYTLELGYLNAGFIFFAVALAGRCSSAGSSAAGVATSSRYRTPARGS